MKNLKINSILLSLLLVSLVFAGDLGFRKYAGEFMEIGVDARAQAMGGAYSAISGEIPSVYYNPAGIYGMQTSQISFMHTRQFISDINYDFIAYGQQQGNSRYIAISLVRLGIDEITDSRKAQVFLESNPDNWRIDPSKLSTFNSADYIFTIGVAQKWRSGWIAGASIKLIRRDLAEYSANGLGFDFGVQKMVASNLNLGFSLRNALTTMIAWNTGEKELVKPALNSGLSYKLRINSIRTTIVPVGEVITRFEGRKESATANAGAMSFDFATGVEVGYHEVLFLRSGLDEISRLNFGVGIQIPHIRFDYAFTDYDSELGNSHRIGLIVAL